MSSLCKSNWKSFKPHLLHKKIQSSVEGFADKNVVVNENHVIILLENNQVCKFDVDCWL